MVARMVGERVGDPCLEKPGAKCCLGFLEEPEKGAFVAIGRFEEFKVVHGVGVDQHAVPRREPPDWKVGWECW